MKIKKALVGLDRIACIPLAQNDLLGYAAETEELFGVSDAAEMDMEADVAKNKIYSDDGLYAEIVSDNGVNVTIKVVELTFETMQKLGFGTFSETTGEFTPQAGGSGMEFALAFRRKQVTPGEYRMYKYFAFTPNEIVESSAKTAGSSPDVGLYEIKGILTKRRYDNKLNVYKDTDGAPDPAWLNAIAPVGNAAGGGESEGA